MNILCIILLLTLFISSSSQLSKSSKVAAAKINVPSAGENSQHVLHFEFCSS